MEYIEHQYPITILESHLDSFGHVNHAVYLKLFEEARWEMVTSRGYGLEKMKQTELGPVILEVAIQYRRELRLRQKVTIHTRIISHNRKLTNLAHTIRDNQEKVYCTAELKFGLFDMKARKLVAPTPEWLKALGVFHE